MNVKELLQQPNPSDIITELKSGRLIPIPDVDLSLAQIEPLKHDVSDPIKRPDKRVKIDPTESNQDAIQVTSGDNSGEGQFRIEKVARIALALQKLIVKRAVSFLFGNPVNLNSEPKTDNEKSVIEAMKRILHDNKSGTLNRRVAKTMFQATEVAEYWYPIENNNDNYGFSSKFKLRCAIFSPLLGDKLYPYFDNNGDLVAFSREFVRVNLDTTRETYFETYTDENTYRWKLESSSWTLLEGFPVANPIKKIPVVFGYQEATEWADVQGLIDRLEKLLSNFADTNDYHASPKIFIQGTVTGFSKKGETGAIIEGEEGSTAEYLAWQNAPESVKLEIETLLKLIHTITQTPDLSWDSVKGIGAVSGIALRLLFTDAHLKVQEKREVFDEYLQRRVNIIKAYIAQFNTKLSKECDTLIIEPEIEPYMIDDEVAKVNLLMTANGNKPIASQKTTVSLLGWAKNTDEELTQIQNEESASNSFLQSEPTPA